MNKHVRYILNKINFIDHMIGLVYLTLFIFMGILLIFFAGMITSHAIIVNPNLNDIPEIPEVNMEQYDSYITQINSYMEFLKIMIYTIVVVSILALYQLIQRLEVKKIMKTIDRVK